MIHQDPVEKPNDEAEDGPDLQWVEGPAKQNIATLVDSYLAGGEEAMRERFNKLFPPRQDGKGDSEV